MYIFTYLYIYVYIILVENVGSENGLVDGQNSIKSDVIESFPDPLYTTNSHNIKTSVNKYRNATVAGNNIRLSLLLEKFIENSKTNESFFLCDHEPVILVSNWLHTIPLTLAERFDILYLDINISTIYAYMKYTFIRVYAYIYTYIGLCVKKQRSLNIFPIFRQYACVQIYMYIYPYDHIYIQKVVNICISV